MATTQINNIKLGFFVIAGFILLVAGLFYIGGNSNIFSNDAELKVRFTNADGLQKGNNVLFSGINAGTVKSITLIDENTIEVVLLIHEDIILHIPENSLASIGTEGLMGNKVVNITPAKKGTNKVSDGDYLKAETKANIDDMLETLSKSNDNIAEISSALKNTALKIENSKILEIIDNEEVSEDLRVSLKNLSTTLKTTSAITASLNDIVNNVKQGKGTAGILLSDEKSAENLKKAVSNIEAASKDINNTAVELNALTRHLNTSINSNGPLNTILTDTTLTKKINNSLDNIEKGTENFNQNMEALKHNFLFRGYFKKLEKQKDEERN